MGRKKSMKEEEWESSAMPTPSRGLVLMMGIFGIIGWLIVSSPKLAFGARILMVGLLAIMAISLIFFEAVTIEEVKK